MGKTVLIMELINNGKAHGGYSVFAGCERTGVTISIMRWWNPALLKQMVKVQGRSGLRADERTSRARARVALTGLTLAEYRDEEGQDVLFFVDNIFRFTQAGSEVLPARPYSISGGISANTGHGWAHCRNGLQQRVRDQLHLFRRFMCCR